jgi:hypothetical protein
VQLSRLIVCACGVKLTSTSKEETFERTENRKKTFSEIDSDYFNRGAMAHLVSPPMGLPPPSHPAAGATPPSLYMLQWHEHHASFFRYFFNSSHPLQFSFTYNIQM